MSRRDDAIYLTSKEADALLKAVRYAQDNGMTCDKWEDGALKRGVRKIKEGRDKTQNWAPEQDSDKFTYSDGVVMAVETDVRPRIVFQFPDNDQSIQVDVAYANSANKTPVGIKVYDRSRGIGNMLMGAESSNVIVVYPSKLRSDQ